MSKSVRKEDTLVLRVSASEKKEIADAAQRAGAGGASAWVRMLALREARKVNREPE
jgi:uncharacterized protein (DUF1778 family)